MDDVTRGLAAGQAIGAQDFSPLRRRLRGELVLPADAGYAQARSVWNGMVDRYPAAVAYCATQDDVIEAVNFARSACLPIAVRSGGHNIAGASVCDDGLVIDLSRMKRIDVDPARGVARAMAGLNLGEFDEATQAFGLATTMGVNRDTGIAGLTLGGGFGKLGRKYGLTCDNLLAAEVVTADGRMVRASASENADLFWGLRGGGGNFGIVTAFEYQLHRLGTTVLVASATFAERHARDALKFYHEFSRNAPDEVSADAALASLPSGARVFSISACYCGPAEQGERVLRPLTTWGTPLETRLARVPYLQVQAAGDSVFPRGQRYYWKAQFLREIADGAIDALLAAFATVPSVGSLVVLQQVGGAIGRVAPQATAFVNRDAAYDCFPVAIWQDPADDEANVRWSRDFWFAMRPFSTGGVYVNNLGDEGADRVRAAYGANYDRLAALKRTYDPANLFSRNANIPPPP